MSGIGTEVNGILQTTLPESESSHPPQVADKEQMPTTPTQSAQAQEISFFSDRFKSFALP